MFCTQAAPNLRACRTMLSGGTVSNEDFTFVIYAHTAWALGNLSLIASGRRGVRGSQTLTRWISSYLCRYHHHRSGAFEELWNCGIEEFGVQLIGDLERLDLIWEEGVCTL